MADSGEYGEETMEMGPSSRAGSGRHTPATMRAMMVGDPTGQTAPSVTGSFCVVFLSNYE